MKRLKGLLRNRKGLTGLETAIIVIAFVIVAAAFAFAVLNMGFQTSQRSTEVMQSGLQEASSAIELDGAVIAYSNRTKNGVDRIEFCIKLSAGKHPVDLSNETLAIAYTDPYIHVYDIYNGTVLPSTSLDMLNEYVDYNSTDDPDRPNAGQYSVHCMATIYEIHGDGDSMLEYGEKFLVVVNVTTVYRYAKNSANIYPQLEPNDEFIIEVKPPVGAILTVIRRLPPALDNVMNLG